MNILSFLIGLSGISIAVLLKRSKITRFVVYPSMLVLLVVGGFFMYRAFQPEPFAFAANTYATWNPSDKGANITLSGSNLVITKTAQAWNAVRSTISKTTGKWYWEVTMTLISGGNAMCGTMTAGATLDASPDSNANNWVYGDGAGEGWSNTSLQFTGNVPVSGDVMGYAFDADADTLGIYINNSLQGTLTSVTGGYASCSVFNNLSTVTANFGSSALTYAPPSGYNAGLYDAGSASFASWQFGDF